MRFGHVVLTLATGLLFGTLHAEEPCSPPMIAIDGEPQASTTCVSGVGYLSSLSPFEVRLLTGSLSPTNGIESIRSATPAPWLTSDPGTDRGNVVDYWSGGIGDPSANALYVVGGGHNNSANNGIYEYNFNGTNAPSGLTLLNGSQSTIASVPTSMSTFLSYSDGKASARHTYDGVAFVDGSIYVVGGSHWRDGGFGNSLDLWRFRAGTWSRLPDSSLGYERPASVADQKTKKILVTTPLSDLSRAQFFDTTTDRWGPVKDTGSRSSVWSDLILVHDTKRSRVIAIGSGYNDVWTVDWLAETIVRSAHPVSGILNSAGITGLYDAVRDRIWIFGGRTGSSGYTTLYEMNPDTFAMTAHTLTGDPIPVSNDNNGSFKRAVLIGNGSAIGFVSRFDAPAVVIPLP